jgi:hypothetical protein
MKINVKGYLVYLSNSGLANNSCYIDDGYDLLDELFFIDKLVQTHRLELEF